MAPRFIRRDPETGADIFQTDDGREVPVASSASPFAQSVMQGPADAIQSTLQAAAPLFERYSRTYTADTGPQSSLDAPTTFGEDLPMPAEWMVDTSQPDVAPPEAPYQPRTLTYGGPEVGERPEASAAVIPPEWFAGGGGPSHQAPAPSAAPPGWREAAREMMPAPPGLVPPPSGRAPAPAAGSGAMVLDGSQGGGAPAMTRRGGRRGGGVRAPQVDPLDALMTGPGGYQDPIAGLAGSPRDRMLDRGGGLIEQAGDLAAQRAALQGQAHEMAQEAAEAGERRRVELENDRRAAMGMAHDRYRRAVERVQAMNVDPSRFFREGGNVIGAAIGIALGAAASSISDDQSHLENAMGLIQQTIDRDIEAQRANISNAQAGLAGEENLLALLSQEFDSREAAEQAARAAMLESVAHRIGVMEADLGTAEARLAAEQAVFDLRQQAQAAAAAAVTAEEDREMERALQMAQLRRRMAQAQIDERRAMGGGGTGALRAPTSQQMTDFNRLVDSGEDPYAVASQMRIAPPRGGRFAEVTTGDQMGTVAAVSASLDALESMIPARGEDIPGVGRWAGYLPDIMVSEEGAALRQQLAATTELIGRLHSGGAISDPEFELFNRILGSASGQSDDRLRQGIEQIRRELNARRSRTIQGSTQSAYADDAARRGVVGDVVTE
jgi:hypothetical protein